MVKKVLKNTSFMFLFATVLAFVYPNVAIYLEKYMVPALIFLMTFSLTEVRLRGLDVKAELNSIAVALMLNYVFLSGIILVLTILLIRDVSLFRGFVVMAAIPPAIATVPLSTLLKGDTRLALMANASIYVLSILLVPVILLLSIGTSTVEPLQMMVVLMELIILPLIISRAIIRTPYYELLKRDQSIPINLGFFIVTYVVIGLNRDILLHESSMLLLVSIIAFMRTFFSGTLVHKICGIFNVPFERKVTYTLFSSYKNLGLAATIALLLFGVRATIPSAVCILFEVSMFTYFSVLFRENR
ncbi:MAG: hypothetical protein PHD13_01775 [Methanocellales archaeon]|nr:hypothetical protein [Methanocellales archaeon]MDD3291008.1 hypothetical protein [Methanocellales archaeon]MDD5234893.1 hypothetical protein [Methanocellales archaeon]MDD5484737.1 hypothetical protein [Methanocellales archaeon]